MEEINSNVKDNKEVYAIVEYTVDTRSRVDHVAQMCELPQIETRKRIDLVEGPFKEFYGNRTWKMPELIKEGRVPLSVRGFMRKRLEVLNSQDKLKRGYWWDNEFNTGDGLFYSPEQKVKIVIDAPIMRELNGTNMIDETGGLVFGTVLYNPAGGRNIHVGENFYAYKEAKGEELEAEQLEKAFPIEKMSPKDAKRNIVLKILSGHNQELLNSYIDAACEYYKRNIFVGNILGLLRTDLYVGHLFALGSDRNLNSINGYCDLESGYEKLIGVKPTALEELCRKNQQ